MYCNKCGTKIPDDSRFCPKCGNGIDPILIQANDHSSDNKEINKENFVDYLKELSEAAKSKGKRFWITLGAVVLLIIILSEALAYISSNKSLMATSYEQEFIIEGKWQSVGDHGIGMAQPGAIVTFDGQNCNVLSPMDNYAFEQNGSSYRLYVSGVMGGNVSFDVEVEDYGNIVLNPGIGNVTKLRRLR